MKKAQEFYVENLSCANCAKKFENRLKSIPSVEEARVNFVASKLSITGEVTVAEIEKAGDFDHIQVHQSPSDNSSRGLISWKNKDNWPLYISLGFIVLAFIFQYGVNSHHDLWPYMFLVAILIGGWDLFKEGLNNLRHFEFDMATLMTVSIIGAVLIGKWQEAAIVVILFAVSEALERYSMDQARHSISQMVSLSPETAEVLVDGQTLTKNVSDIQIGDVLLVKPGQRVAMDGVVIEGRSAINQAAITGESVPVEKTTGDQVFAGTLNETGVIQVDVKKRQADNTLSRIIRLVEDAQEKKAATQSFIDKFAKYYTPIIMLLALLVIIIPPLFFSAKWEDWIYQGLSILIIGCPCALIISTPVAIVTAIGNAAHNGVLIKGGTYLEALGRSQVVAFDKTGTLTQGHPSVTDAFVINDYSKAWSILYTLENNTTHPLAGAITTYIDQEIADREEVSLTDVEMYTGKGMSGKAHEETFYVGSPSLFIDHLGMDISSCQSTIQSLQEQGKTTVIFGTAQEIILVLGISDEVRSNSQEVIKELHRQGIETIMLTGDHPKVAHKIGQKLGLGRVEADLMPEDKLAIIQSLQAKQAVAMVGDGVNDAPALAAAHVGIAMGNGGTDAALETADVALLSGDLSSLPYSITLSKKTLQIIKENVAFALVLKLLALLLVIPGWLTLWLAIFSDIGATVIVVLNSMRLIRYARRD